ncbi:MAG: hypothetical protein J7M26_08680, partial [Armatimonadetes bacterium]|nr:hypothetical protein [Armatimonadota bacterium]
LANWGLIRVVTRAGDEQATFMVARSERDLRERLRAIPEWQRRRIVSVEDMGPAGHGLGAGLRQYRIVYRDLSEAEVQITRYGRLEAAGIHTPTGPRRYKVRWPAGWTKLDDNDRIALIASRRIRGPWADHDLMPERLRGRAPRIVFDPAIGRGEKLPHYDHQRHAIVVAPPPGPKALEADKVAYREILLHEAGHASKEGWQCYEEFGWLHEGANETVAQAILRALHPRAQPTVAYHDEIAAMVRILGRRHFIRAAAQGQRALCEAIEERLQHLRRTARPRLGTREELQQMIDDALELVRHRFRHYGGANPLCDLLDTISWRVFGHQFLFGAQLQGILDAIGQRYRRRLGL